MNATTATSVNIRLVTKDKTHNLRYESEAEAIEIFRDMLVNDMGVDAETANGYVEELQNNADGVLVNHGGRGLYYRLIRMAFEGGERVAVTYANGKRREGTVARRTAATAQDVKVQFDGFPVLQSVSLQGLERI